MKWIEPERMQQRDVSFKSDSGELFGLFIFYMQGYLSDWNFKLEPLNPSIFIRQDPK